MTLVAGMLPVVMFAGTAAAAAPTVLSVTTASTLTVKGEDPAVPGTATYTVGFNNDLGPGGIYYAIASGPDGANATFAAAKPCPVNVNATDSTCSVEYNGNAGTNNLVFFYSPTTAAPVQYTANAPQVTGTLIITGPVNAITAAPATAHVAQGQSAKYTLTATDADGNAIPDQTIDIHASQADTTLLGRPHLRLTPTTPTCLPWQGLDPAGLLPETADLQVTTGATGSVSFCASSTVAGTVNLTFTPNPTVPGIQGAATLTVDPGAPNDVTQVVIDPSAQNAFQGAPVRQLVSVLNAQGDLVGGPGVVPPGSPMVIASITSGPNIGRPVTVTDFNPAFPRSGKYWLDYTTLGPSGNQTTTGTDTLQAFVNHTPGSASLDPGEPSATATITVAGRPDGLQLIQLDSQGNPVPPGTPVAAFTNSKTATVIFELRGTKGPLSGYGVNLAVDGAASLPASQRAGYSIDPALAVTGADGRFVATVTNANPLIGDTVAITATLVGDSTIKDALNVVWQAPADVVTIQPSENTAKIGGSATFTASTVNPIAGNPVSGVIYFWQVKSGSTFINGVGATFTYTDKGSATTDHTEVVTVDAFQNGTLLGTDTASQNWVRGGVAEQANITLGQLTGDYSGQGVNPTIGPFTPSGFVSTLTAGVIADPTPTIPQVGSVIVGVKLADANNNRLFGQVVTFTSSGVGSFVDSTGKTIGNTVTAPVTSPSGFATVNVRSSVAGVQKITATVNGISTVGTITWSGQYVPLTPFRVFDTRTGQGGVGTDPVTLNTLTYFDYANTALPLDASAYVFNVTAIGPNDVGNLRIADACDGSLTRSSTVPDTSLVNYQVGKTIANAIVVPSTSAYCGLRVYSDNAPVDVAIDVEGYYIGGDQVANAAFRALTPTRIADTRTGINTGGASDVAAGATVGIQITGTNIIPGQPGIPADAKAVAVNLTAIDPNALGNLRVFPDGAPVPNASNVNYIPGVDKAAFAVVDLPANGKINVFSDGATIGLAVDVFGYYPATSNVVTQAPVRVFDSRNTGSLQANVPLSFPVAGHAGVPADAQAVLVSVTSIHNAASTGVGNLRIFPAGVGLPNISNVNYISPTSDVANFAIVSLGGGGELTLYSDGTPIDAAVDVVGYVPAGS